MTFEKIRMSYDEEIIIDNKTYCVMGLTSITINPQTPIEIYEVTSYIKNECEEDFCGYECMAIKLKNSSRIKKIANSFIERKMGPKTLIDKINAYENERFIKDKEGTELNKLLKCVRIVKEEYKQYKQMIEKL